MVDTQWNFQCSYNEGYPCIVHVALYQRKINKIRLNEWIKPSKVNCTSKKRKKKHETNLSYFDTTNLHYSKNQRKYNFKKTLNEGL